MVESRYQRILGLAMALGPNPQLLLLDEPAAGMNRDEILLMSRMIRDLNMGKNITVLLVEHNMNLVMDIWLQL